jgi:hypothetical protein
LLFAVDHVYWTEAIAEAAKGHASQTAGTEAGAGGIWFLGTASKRTRSELSRLGFEVNENVASMMVATGGE